jgi:tRNA pseudouridine-54 N-methylase
MTIYAIRLVAQTTRQGSIDFKVEAASPSAAAAIIAEAHNQREASDSGLMFLPDGQEELFEIVDVVSRERSFFLLDETGEEVSEIPLVDAPSPPSRRHPA